MRKRHSDITWKELLVQSVILLALLACAFPGTFLRGETTLPGNLLYNLSPWRVYATGPTGQDMNFALIEAFTLFHKYFVLTQAALENGEWPLWNHLENMGMPLLANYQSMVFYPPRLLHAFLEIGLATTLFTLLKLWLCGFTAYICGRAIRLGRVAACFFSVAWMLGGFNVIWCYWSPTDVAAWLPIIFMGIEFILDGRYRRGFFSVAFGATLLLLAGAPETAFAMGLGVGMYFFLRLAFERRWGRALFLPIACAGGAWGAALLIAAAQIIPFAEYLANSDTFFSRPGVEVDEFMYQPSSLITMFVSRFFGSDVDGNFWAEKLNQTYLGMIYVGVAVWLSAVSLSATAKTRPGERLKAVCLLVPCVIGGLLAFRHPILDVVHGLPIFGSMRPVYHSIFAMFALPLLAAKGLDLWFSTERRLRDLLPILIFALVIGAGIGAYFMFNKKILFMQGYGPFIVGRMLVTVLFAVLAIAILGAYCFWKRARFLSALLVIVVACDLLVAVHGYNHTCPRDELFIDTALTRFLQNEGVPCRTSTTTAGITLGLLQDYGIEQWHGYDGMYPRRFHEFKQRLGDDIWKAMEPACAVQYYLYPNTVAPDCPEEYLSSLVFQQTLDQVDIYKNSRAFPRAFLVCGSEVVPDIDSTFARMASPEFNPREIALLESPQAGLTSSPSQSLSDAVITEYRSTRVTIDTDSSVDAILVLADAYYPGWSASIDGQPAEVFPVDYLLRGMSLPAGKHTVEFAYFPTSFRLGLAVSTISLIAIGLVSALTILSVSRRGRGGQPACPGV